MSFGIEVTDSIGRTLTSDTYLPRKVATYTVTGVGSWTYTPGNGYDSTKKGNFCELRTSNSQAQPTHYVTYNGASITIANITGTGWVIGTTVVLVYTS
jgi:hypothetical protein